jgi:mitochondrial import receptor subunit TOM40
MASTSAAVPAPAPVPVPVPVAEKPSASLPGYLAPLRPLADAYGRYSAWRAALGLPHPGTAENLQKETKGARAASARPPVLTRAHQRRT